MKITTLLVPMFLTLACSCAPVLTPAVPVTSRTGDARLLAGTWQGDFWSSQTGRHGRISFEMAAGTDSARGQILMYFRDPSQAIWSGDVTSQATRRPAEREWLSIRFVDVEGGTLNGVMEPYTDPLCACLVHTSFIGRLDRNRLEGTYTSRGIGREYESGGRWSAERK